MSTTKTKNTIVDKALHYFNTEGWNCTESVYMAIFKEYHKINQIVDQYGSIHCSRLTECQLTSLEGIRKFREENIKENLCTPLIRKVMETFLQMVKNNKPT